MRADGVLLLGFGGVTDACCGRKLDADGAGCPGRVECFVSKVLGDDPRMAARVTEVAAHYHHLGGTSPYNPLTLTQAEALEAELGVPVRCGFRNWPPWYGDGLTALRDAGCRSIALAVLAAHQTSRSWDQYIDEAQAAAAELGMTTMVIGPTDPWWDHPGFIAANAARLRTVLADWEPERFTKAALVLTAHAIPQPAERTSPYRQQVEDTARLVAEAVDHPDYRLAFQSAPDQSRIPWSTPRVEDVVAEAINAGHQDIIVQAVGFLVDHVEVLYDLDHEIADQCRAAGVTYTRAACVHEHPAFIGCLAERIRAV